MDELGMWLRNNIPEQGSKAARLSILHGDYRIDNLIYVDSSIAKPTVKAVLDWELSSIGVATADLTYNCLSYYLPPKGF